MKVEITYCECDSYLTSFFLSMKSNFFSDFDYIYVDRFNELLKRFTYFNSQMTLNLV